MSMLRSITAAVCFVCAASFSAQADFPTGCDEELYFTSANLQDDTSCIVYITGAVDAFITAELIAEKTGMAPGL